MQAQLSQRAVGQASVQGQTVVPGPGFGQVLTTAGSARNECRRDRRCPSEQWRETIRLHALEEGFVDLAKPITRQAWEPSSEAPFGLFEIAAAQIQKAGVLLILECADLFSD